VELKARLVAAPILRRPIRGHPFQLHIDWNMLGLGAMLTQCDDEVKEFVVAYASCSNNAAKSHYSSYEGECLTTVWVPNVDGTVDPSLAMVRVGLRCILCGSRGGATHMLVCDRCSRGWHMACMTPPMDVVHVGWWVCPRCTLEG
jgi:hypothetical protein